MTAPDRSPATEPMEPARDHGVVERLQFPDIPRLELDQLLEQLRDGAQDVLATQGRLRGLLRANAAVAADLSLPAVATAYRRRSPRPPASPLRGDHRARPRRTVAPVRPRRHGRGPGGADQPSPPRAARPRPVDRRIRPGPASRSTHRITALGTRPHTGRRFPRRGDRQRRPADRVGTTPSLAGRVQPAHQPIAGRRHSRPLRCISQAATTAADADVANLTGAARQRRGHGGRGDRCCGHRAGRPNQGNGWFGCRADNPHRHTYAADRPRRRPRDGAG